MSLHQDNSKNHSPIGYNKKCEIEGLDSFKSNLEKYFFAKVDVRNCSTENTSAKLVIELDCNFGLAEMLYYLKIGSWGNFNNKDFSLSTMLYELKEANNLCIELEEFSIFLKDTSIIINKVYENSIPEQVAGILEKINDNYLRFTKCLTEIPYEIFVPVFEEGVMENDTALMNVKSGNANSNDYFKFWGLYFYSDEDAVIYDVNNTAIVTGNLEMLNR